MDHFFGEIDSFERMYQIFLGMDPFNYKFPGIFFTPIINNNQCQRPVVRLVDGSSSGEMHQLSKEVAQAAAAAVTTVTDAAATSSAAA